MKKTTLCPAIFAYGFRPFFLAAGIYATTAIPLWISSLYGYSLPGSLRSVHAWHAHEMIFGFIVAAVAGFLLTAIPSWTGRRGYAGAPLIGLTLLWFAGRIVIAFPLGLPPMIVALVDLAFLPALAIMLLPALIRSGNRRNLVFVALLASLFATNLHFHIKGAVDVAPLQTGINIMLVMVAVVGARIIPVFTSSGLKQAGINIKIPRNPVHDTGVLIAVVAVLIVDLFAIDSTLAAVAAAGTALLLSLQMTRWQGQQTLREPIIWILHVGYIWIPVALALKAAWLFGLPIPATSWLHALTAGAFSTMILGVMTRAALGHTGRKLIAPFTIIISYFLLTGAALTRVFGPILNAGAWWMTVSAVLWCLAFALFVVIYAPILCRPRADGRAG